MRRLAVILVATLGGCSGRAGCSACRSDTAQPFRASTFTPAVHAAPARSAGCGVVRESPDGEAFRVGDRAFYVWGPRVYHRDVPAPVVLAFHGWGSNGRGFQKWFKMEQQTGGAAFVVYPDAKERWDTDGDEDLVFVDAMLERLGASYCLDRARVLAFGFSWGGRFAHHLGCKRPSSVRAIAAGGSAWPGADTSCTRALPVLMTHRTHDENEKFDWGKRAEANWTKHDGCSEESDVVDDAHGCRAHRACAPGGSVTFCEDTWYSPSWPSSWNHTVREEYRALTWAWFESLP